MPVDEDTVDAPLDAMLKEVNPHMMQDPNESEGNDSCHEGCDSEGPDHDDHD